MKRLSLVLVGLLYVSTSFGMGNGTLKTSLDTLVVRLEALEQQLAPGSKPVVSPKPKVKDPLKQAVAKFLAGLSQEQRTEFQSLSEEERADRLAQVFAQGKTTPPVPPSPKGQTPTASPEPEQKEGEDGSTGTFAPPPPPPFGGPGAPPPPPFGVKTDTKPVVAKPVKPLLAVLSTQDLASKSSEDKQRSDAFFLQMLLDNSSIEYDKLADMEAAIKQALTVLRDDESFLRREQLDQVLSRESGLLALLKKDFSVDQTAKRTRLEELYESFTKVKPSLLFQSLIQQLSGCLFDASGLSAESLELLCVTYITAQRGPQPSLSEVGRETRDKSDKVYIAQWKTLTNVEDGINDLVRQLNFVRMHPDFLLYQNMLWRSDRSSQAAMTGTLPLLLLLKSPQSFKNIAYGVIEATIKSHVFNIDEFEVAIDKTVVKTAFEWQKANSKTVELISLQDFVLARLKQIKSLSALKNLFTQLGEKYQQDVAPLQGQILQAVAQLEPTNPKIDLSIIAGTLQTLMNQQVPADIKKNIETMITAATKDRELVSAVFETLKSPGNFSENLMVRLEKDGNLLLAQQVKAVTSNLYRTPRDLYDLLVAQLGDKKALADQQEAIMKQIKEYGILLGAFRYYVDQYKRNPESVEVLKQNLGMLIKSLGVIANPTAQLGAGKSATEEIQGRLFGVRELMAGRKELLGLPFAPELFDIAVGDNLIGKEKAAYYTRQLTKYDFYKGQKLLELLGYIKQEKNPEKVVAFVTQLVSQAQGVDINGQEFKQFMADVRQALQGTYDKGIDPKYIE